MHTPFDVTGWLQRAEQFVRRLNRLPGRCGISVSIEPPVNFHGDSVVAAEFTCELPPLLRRLYTEGSAGFECRYHWTPDSKHLLQVASLFPHQYSFYGGPDFIPWNELPRSPGVFTGWFDENHHTPAQKIAATLCERVLPFIYVGNGDIVGVTLTGDPDSTPVVYISHEDFEDPVSLLAESLERFLENWELLSYIGPEIWLFEPLLDRTHAGTRVNAAKAAQWRELLLGRAGLH